MNRHLGTNSFFLRLCAAICLLAISPLAFSQTVPNQIQVVVVDGEGVITNIHERVAPDPSVKVEDEDHRPISGAVVVFALPVYGTSGEFANGAKNLEIMTGADGIAVARGLRVNETPGKLQIYVTASYHGLRARGFINQTVAVPAGTKAPLPAVHTSKSNAWKWVLLGVAVAGGAGAAAYLTHSNSNTSPTPVTITTGTVVFGSTH
jgi:hypothetical protein